MCRVHNADKPGDGDERMTQVPDADRVTAEIEYELTLLSRYHTLSRQRGKQKLERSAYLLLSRLELEAPMSLKELSEAFRLDISTINRQVGALERNGYVERVADPDGGVARKIRPTELGLHKLLADRETNCRGVDSVLTEWSDEDSRSLRDMLVRFNRAVEQIEGRPWPRPGES